MARAAAVYEEAAAADAALRDEAAARMAAEYEAEGARTAAAHQAATARMTRNVRARDRTANGTRSRRDVTSPSRPDWSPEFAVCDRRELINRRQASGEIKV